METKPTTYQASISIDPGTNIGAVTLRVADLDRSLSFYQGMSRLPAYRAHARQGYAGCRRWSRLCSNCTKYQAHPPSLAGQRAFTTSLSSSPPAPTSARL